MSITIILYADKSRRRRDNIKKIIFTTGKKIKTALFSKINTRRLTKEFPVQISLEFLNYNILFIPLQNFVLVM